MAMVRSETAGALQKLRKRDRPKAARKKLLVGEKVERRSEEEGFLGSWHSGTIVACDKKLLRRFMYDHFLAEDDSGQLVETVAVSPILDGVVSGDAKFPGRSRGNLRPFPPPALAQASELRYGLCVDANYNTAWWEGVIFDHEDGAETRTVFFPDLGDEMKVAIGDLRITQDWDEGTGIWRRRGNWVFCELIEEIEETHGLLPISVKQIWYDVRGERDFIKKVRDWNLGAKGLWKKMVSEVIDVYLDFLRKELLRRIELSQ